jgi:hypothetical protein
MEQAGGSSRALEELFFPLSGFPSPSLFSSVAPRFLPYLTGQQPSIFATIPFLGIYEHSA